VPPRAYGGTERVVYELVAELVRRGHAVTTFASGDSDVPGKHVETVPRALWPDGFGGDTSGWFVSTIQSVLARAADFDIVHGHLEWYGPLLAALGAQAGVPVVSTFHGRLDLPWAGGVLAAAPGRYVAISRSQAAAHPRFDWAGVVHNGLRLDDAPFGSAPSDALCFVGRVGPEKGILDAIAIAEAAGRPLRIAAKVGTMPAEHVYHDDVFLPALRKAGGRVEFLGELEDRERDALFADSYATLMPGSWPEPFGLVAIESLACGTPILARPAGALPEIVRDGVDGFFAADVEGLAAAVDRVGELDRAAIRASVVDRFSSARMADGYEAIYAGLISPEGETRAQRIAAATTGDRATG
jgi:glycosyltransferase involved in cell wall biosynthesis